jgi:hypothetical protein
LIGLPPNPPQDLRPISGAGATEAHSVVKTAALREEILMRTRYINRVRTPGRWSLDRVMLAFALTFVAWIILGY